jgi:putative ABC transport system ATP-binding protein
VTAILDVSRLRVAYGATVVLADFDLTVAAGESVAIMGPSGSGKSSLLACVTGMKVPTAGHVRLGPDTMSDLTAGARAALRRTALGLIFQDAELLPELNVEENVALTLLFDGHPRAQALSLARDILASLGLADHATKRTDEISGGQAQRVALARALVRPSMRLLVADEPTAALDAGNATKVMTMLLTKIAELQAGALIATHDQAVAQMCDRVLDLRSLSASVDA